MHLDDVKDEIYDVAFQMERFASTGLKEGPQTELRELVDRLRKVARETGTNEGR